MSSMLWKKTNYLLDIPYVTSNYITEYDLSKANISALLYNKMISKEDYDFLYNLPKIQREIRIGLLRQKDSKYTKAVNSGIEQARKMFFEANNVQDSEILSIKNDAIFLISSRPVVSDFGIFKFNKKGSYTLFMNTSINLEIYYNFDPLNNSEDIEVKGISEENLYLFKDSILNFLCNIFYMIENNTIEDTIQFYNEFYEQYINKKLDIRYYREFGWTCKYRIRSIYKDFVFDHIDESNKQYLDIEYNLKLLRDIHACLADIYFRKQNSR